MVGRCAKTPSLSKIVLLPSFNLNLIRSSDPSTNPSPPPRKPFVTPACPGYCTTAYRSSPAAASKATPAGGGHDGVRAPPLALLPLPLPPPGHRDVGRVAREVRRGGACPGSGGQPGGPVGELHRVKASVCAWLRNTTASGNPIALKSMRHQAAASAASASTSLVGESNTSVSTTTLEV